jgi:hypothetical protein
MKAKLQRWIAVGLTVFAASMCVRALKEVNARPFDESFARLRAW